MNQNGVPPPMHPQSAPPTPIQTHLKGSVGGTGGTPHSYSGNNSPALPSGVQLPSVPRVVMNQPQHHSARAIMLKSPESPATFPTFSASPAQKTERRLSLVGFDPLLGGSAVQPAPLNQPPPIENTKAPTPRVAAPTKPMTPKPSQNNDESFKSPEEKRRKEQRSSSQERSSNNNADDRMPPTPPKQSSDIPTSPKTISPKPKSGPSRKDLFTISITRRESASNQTTPKVTEAASADANKAKEEPTPSNSVGRKLAWVRGRRLKRSTSLENKELPGKPRREPRSASVHEKGDASETKTSMYNSIVRDLMELSFDKLQLPTLAKPLPTSFLTGREGEVMRTCEYEAAPFQMEIPALSELMAPARLNEFVENYRRIDQNFDLQEWKGLSSMDLRRIKLVQHIPIAQLLLECGDDVSIQGVVTVGSNADNRVEAVIFEGQRNFIVVIRGTTEQQSKPCQKKTTNRKAVRLDAEHEHVEVYQCFLDEYQKIEKACFALLDKLTEENPFCDVVFTGHSFGGALSTLAAVRYSNARPMMRVKCYPMASPKLGFSEFRQMVNSSPNLRVMRLEYGQDAKCQLPGPGGSHVGHTLVLHSLLGHNSHKTKDPVLAYKFDAPKHKKFKTTHPDLRSYVVALEEISRLNLPWAQDFVGTSGQGVVVNNEARQMV